jgi:hypothetical protein
LCKPYQTTENCVVSPRKRAFFHRLINTGVENLISQKYSARNSARMLLWEKITSL